MRMKTTHQRLAICFLLAAPARLVLAQPPHPIPAKRPEKYTYQIVQTFPHDPNAFTQGLVYRDGFLY